MLRLTPRIAAAARPLAAARSVPAPLCVPASLRKRRDPSHRLACNSSTWLTTQRRGFRRAARRDAGNIYAPKSLYGLLEYQETYERSMKDPVGFWAEHANKLLHWEKPFESVLTGGFEHGDVQWFRGGKLNASVNCIDRHLSTKANQVAIIWEGDEPGTNRHITYRELHREVCKIANALKYQGVRKGDIVTLYMPMIPELAMTMLACTRIGAIHNVVFAGFSANALADRVEDAKSKWIVTANEGKRGGRTIPLKQIVDEAIESRKLDITNVFLFKRTDTQVRIHDRDLDMYDLMQRQRPFVAAEALDSEDPIFMLYTSGSTGKPKGLVHTHAGYLTWIGMNLQYSFDVRPNDVFACVADVGWITGHSFTVYAPLLHGVTTVMFESTPLYPDPGRLWRLVEQHQATQLYTSPTAVRSLMRQGDEYVHKYDRSSLRVLAIAGEPINVDAWKWLHDVVGNGEVSVVDTWWQTETGGPMGTPQPGRTPLKPGSCSLPMYGVAFDVVDADSGKKIDTTEAEGLLVISKPWPGLARTIHNDHQRYLDAYMKPYPGFYFTGDGVTRDADGFYWITGRVDDVINVSGHRIGTSELEGVLTNLDEVVECAVVGYPHETKGEAIACFVIMTQDIADEHTNSTIADLSKAIRSEIGPFATPDVIFRVLSLPKTRSGKIMRRLLRKIVHGERHMARLGDLSTLSEPETVHHIIERVQARFNELQQPQQ